MYRITDVIPRDLIDTHMRGFIDEITESKTVLFSGVYYNAMSIEKWTVDQCKNIEALDQYAMDELLFSGGVLASSNDPKYWGAIMKEAALRLKSMRPIINDFREKQQATGSSRYAAATYANAMMKYDGITTNVELNRFRNERLVLLKKIDKLSTTNPVRKPLIALVASYCTTRNPPKSLTAIALMNLLPKFLFTSIDEVLSDPTLLASINSPDELYGILQEKVVLKQASELRSWQPIEASC